MVALADVLERGILLFMTNYHDPENEIPLSEDWPSPEELENLVGEHGRKKDFTYEQSRTSGKEEAGAASKGISKQGD